MRHTLHLFLAKEINTKEVKFTKFFSLYYKHYKPHLLCVHQKLPILKYGKGEVPSRPLPIENST
jgi:hypothetical protein